VILDGFLPLAMRSSNDCGPTAMLQALRHSGVDIDYDELLRVWRFRRGADRTDTPGHHLRALGRLGVAFSIRRRLGRGRIARALQAGRPVVMLVPTGVLRWHWIVACGVEHGRLMVSRGDGGTAGIRWDDLSKVARARPEGRALRVDGLGYSLGRPAPFETDVALERDLVRLARIAEGTLGPCEPLARLLPSPSGAPGNGLCSNKDAPACRGAGA